MPSVALGSLLPPAYTQLNARSPRTAGQLSLGHQAKPTVCLPCTESCVTGREGWFGRPSGGGPTRAQPAQSRPPRLIVTSWHCGLAAPLGWERGGHLPLTQRFQTLSTEPRAC